MRFGKPRKERRENFDSNRKSENNYMYLRKAFFAFGLLRREKKKRRRRGGADKKEGIM